MTKLQDKFQAIASGLNSNFSERGPIVSGMLCAAVAGEHVLLIGEPGTAKSALTRQFCESFDGARYFEWLLTKYSVPEELFGPPSLAALKNGSYERVTANKLPEAHIVFLDEIFKANSGVLNALLTAINERIFHDGSKAKAIPLRTLVGASNELPEGSELAALYDRFLLRYYVQGIANENSLQAMLMATLNPIVAQVTLAELDQANQEARAVDFDLAACAELMRIRRALASKGVTASDRRWKRCVGLLRANAWLSGDPAVTIDHFEVLADALWTDLAGRQQVAATVGGIVDSAIVRAQKHLEVVSIAFKGLAQEKPSHPTKQWQERLIGVANEIVAAAEQIDAEIKKQTSEKAKAKIVKVYSEVHRMREEIREMLRESVDGI